MTTFYAKDYSINHTDDISVNLIKLLEEIKNTSGEKELIFENGNYLIDADNCVKEMLYITNTVGDDEFSKDETPHLNTVAIYLNGIDNLTIKGNGAIFLIDGKISNLVIKECKNITVENIEFRHLHPNFHELKVINKSIFYVDFKLDEDSNYRNDNGNIVLYGKGFEHPLTKCSANSWWNCLIKAKTPNKTSRVPHPLAGALKIKEIGDRTFRVYYPITKRFDLNDIFYIFDTRRQFVGIFSDSSENVKLIDVKQRFNYSLAFVAQNSVNITMDKCEFAPEEGSVRKVVSAADFVHMCMCRGDIKITNSLFSGACDDCLNVHGIHFKTTKIDGNKITIRFMHKQAHGFLPFRINDNIAFINPETLLEHGQAKVVDAKLLNEYEIELTLDSAKDAVLNEVIENTSACANVYFANNTLNRIITRAILLTTRGKVLVENNHFISNSMSGILLSDDAKSWYESGMCKDVTIRNNVFDYCGETPILIKPENAKHKGAVHKNIVIENNEFNNYENYCIDIKSSDNVKIQNNKYCNKKVLKTKNCTNIESK